MRNRSKTFEFTAELGARLRQLRRRAELTLEEQAHVMGRPVGFSSHLSRLESGKVPFPSLALVADYLRACRASFDHLTSLLGAYTGQLPVREPRAREKVLSVLEPLRGREAARLGVYDRKMSGRLSPEARARAARKQTEAVRERRLLDNLMRAEVNRLGVRPTMVVFKVSNDYARMVWRALELTKPRPKPKSKRGRPRKTRKQRLQEARTRIRALAPRVLPAKALSQIRDKVILLYQETHRLEERWNGPV